MTAADTLGDIPAAPASSALDRPSNAGSSTEADANRNQAAPRDDARRHVLWCGGPLPIEAVHAFTGRGCEARAIEMDVSAVAAYASEARAIIIEVPTSIMDAAEWAGPVVEAALTHGLGVVLTMAAVLSDDPLELDTARIGQFVASVTTLVRAGEPRVRRTLRLWSEIAHWVTAVHRAGPAPNMMLQIDGDVPSDPVARMLLRRAFHDLTGISLKSLQGGKSGAGVWEVMPDAADAERRASPFLVKYNTLRKTQEEQSRYSLYADERVSFRLRPPLHSARYVEGPEHGLLVFDFVERTISFRAALLAFPAGQLVGSLFSHTLAGCLRTAREVQGELAAPYARINVLQWTDGLRAAAARARADQPTLPDVDSLRRQIESLPAVRHRVATAHGDLHTGNLLVAAGSSDVLLIDFGSINFGMPVATDPACLEVSITFAPTEVALELGRPAPATDAEWLRSTYRFPLEPFTVPERHRRDAWLTDTVRAIRGAHRQLEADTVPYAVAVASYLVRYAAYPDNGSEDDRALAYELACGLIEAAGAEISRRVAANTTSDLRCVGVPASPPHMPRMVASI